jgi:NIMA (never in mitosis gene a)-related kinase
MEKYNLGKALGTGAFGSVYKATTTIDGRVVSIKMIDLAKTNEAVTRAEVDALIQLNHPNVVKYFESFKHETYFCIVMEFCEGKNLREIIKEQTSPLPESYILRIFFQMVDVLKFCHEKKVMHRDLKPENIILSPNYEVKLIDFGVAKILQEGVNSLTTYAESPNYMSSEIVQGNKYSFASDIRSLGVIVYELMTFKRPFDDQNLIEMSKKICSQEPPAITLNYSVELIEVVRSMLSKNPVMRCKLKTLIKHPTLWNFQQTKIKIRVSLWNVLKKNLLKKRKPFNELSLKTRD